MQTLFLISQILQFKRIIQKIPSCSSANANEFVPGEVNLFAVQGIELLAGYQECMESKLNRTIGMINEAFFMILEINHSF